jgi:GNAT superfamily N-acetyltransferase
VRIAVWGTATLVLLLPLFAMQVTDEVAWDLADFAIFGAMLVGACGTYELAARMTGNGAYRAAVGVALAAAFVLVWMNLAVGVIGTEDNPAKLMYGGVLAVGIIGAVVARFRPHGMARALVATALAQASVAVIALIGGLGHALVLTGIFVALWLTSAWLFRKAAREQTPTGVAP